MNTMHDKAPKILMNVRLPKCVDCNQENSVKLIIAEKKKNISIGCVCCWDKCLVVASMNS